MTNQRKRVMRYLTGRMSEKQKIKFLKELESDGKLKDELQMMTVLKDSILAKQLQDEMEQSGELADIDKMLARGDYDAEENLSVEASEDLRLLVEDALKYEKGQALNVKDHAPKTIQLRRNFRYVVLAAAVALVLLVLGIQTVDPSGVKLYERYYETVDARGYNYKSAGDEDGRFRVALDLYKGEKYVAALEEFNTVQVGHVFYEDAVFYKGMCELELERFDDASMSFSAYLEEYEKFELDAVWYLCLSYIQKGEFNAALPHLKQMAAWETIYQKDARKLARRLRRQK